MLLQELLQSQRDEAVPEKLFSDFSGYSGCGQDLLRQSNSSEKSENGDFLLLRYVKINKKIANEHFLLDHATPFCSCYAAEQRALRQEDRMGAPRVLNFYGSQLNRISDAISVKRGELLRIKKLLQSRLGTSDTAARYHYEDMILRINTALGIK